MRVEIWTDIACPFCYIGKHNFEKALTKFDKEVEIIHHSFELDPSITSNPTVLALEDLAAKYKISLEKAHEMNEHVTQMAKTAGLDYHMDNIRAVNTFDAHRLAHFAKEKGKMGELLEKFFDAHFTKETYLGDSRELIKIAVSIGLDKDEATTILNNDNFSKDVRADEKKAQQIGIQGVPFFLFNQKYAISGAQQPEAFLKTLQKVSAEENIIIEANGDSCSTDGCI